MKKIRAYQYLCQCPLGLIPHFYFDSPDGDYWGVKAGVNALSGLYLISTTYYNYNVEKIDYSVNALSGLYLISTSAAEKKYSSEVSKCQCPLGLIPHFYVRPSSDKRSAFIRVSMPSRAYTSFLRYPFKNLGFMRFPEPVFAGIYQNILTTAVFHAC